MWIHRKVVTNKKENNKCKLHNRKNVDAIFATHINKSHMHSSATQTESFKPHDHLQGFSRISAAHDQF